MKRSRLGQIGSSGSNRSKRCHKQYATGASAIGVPGCPELAACTASMDRVRMVLMQRRSRSGGGPAMRPPVAVRLKGSRTHLYWQARGSQQIKQMIVEYGFER